MGSNPSASTHTSAHVIYRERLIPSLFAFLFAQFMIGSLGIAYAHVYGNTVGWLTVIALGPAAWIGMYYFSPVLEISEKEFRLGRALIPRQFIGTIHTLNDGQTKDASGHAAHRDAYIVLRSWMPYSVIFEITDVTDPHPYWHFSTREPEKVRELLS